MPLLDAKEMANRNVSEVVARLRRAPYAGEFDALLSLPGTHILDDEEGVISWVLTALEFYEQSPEDFHPFSSKYDDYMRGRTQLTAQEKRGFAIFNDTKRGNCAQCHPSVATSSNVIFPRFTDFEFAALGVPRNRQIPANRDTDPKRWYGKQGARYNDLPEALRGHVKQIEPFKPLPGGKPRLSPRDINDLLAFIQTLTDRDLLAASRH